MNSFNEIYKQPIKESLLELVPPARPCPNGSSRRAVRRALIANHKLKNPNINIKGEFSLIGLTYNPYFWLLIKFHVNNKYINET